VALRAPHFSRWATALVAVAALGSGTACGPTGAGPADRPAAPPASTAPAVTPADEEAARAAALTAYRGYLEASRVASRKGDPQHPDLRKYLADPLLTRVRLTIREAKEHGAMRTGKLVSDPVVTTVSLDTVPSTVEIQDCLDATGYRLVYTKNQKVVPGTTGRRYLATATAARYPDGRWLITTGFAHEEQPC
jgi:hypothetical protein